MYAIKKQFEFSASHQLAHLAPEHQCARLHGHNYVVEIELQADELDSRGFVVDYGELREFKAYIDHHFDHQHLNAIFRGHHTTAENLARHFYEWCASRWPQTAAARVSETPKTWAEYRPDPIETTLETSLDTDFSASVQSLLDTINTRNA